jgi:hypothetical protein
LAQSAWTVAMQTPSCLASCGTLTVVPAIGPERRVEWPVLAWLSTSETACAAAPRPCTPGSHEQPSHLVDSRS